MSSQETALLQKIRLAFGKITGVRMFRNNVGKCWIGKPVRFEKRTNVWVNPGDVLVSNARFFEAGLCTGSSDLIGLKTIIVTAEMIGKKIAVFTACEVKDKGYATDEQKAFINMVINQGGIGMIVRSEEEAIKAMGS